MPVRGIVRGNVIDLAEPLDLPDGSNVEIEILLLPPEHNPFWGLLRDYDALLHQMEQEIMEERERAEWRSLGESIS